MIREILTVLFPCVVILYCLDSIQLINRKHILFVCHFGKRYYLKKSGIHISKLSPIGTTILSHDIPVCFTSRGLYTIINEQSFDKNVFASEDFHFIFYQDIDTVELDGKEIQINGKKFLKAPSSMHARIIQEKIKEIRIIKPSLRIKKIKDLFEESLSIEQAESLNESCSNYLLNLKIVSLFLFLNTMIILPSILYSKAYLFINLQFIGTYIILTYFIVLVLTSFIHMKVYKTEKKQRIYSVLSMIFSPVSVMHASNYITSDLYACFHYLAIAKLLLPSDIFVGLVRKELILIEHYKRIIDDSDWLEYWELREMSITNLIEKAGYTRNEVLTVPDKQDENSICYCPICLSEYISDIKKCSDCNVELKKYN